MSEEEVARCSPVGCDGVVCDPEESGEEGGFVNGIHYRFG